MARLHAQTVDQLQGKGRTHARTAVGSVGGKKAMMRLHFGEGEEELGKGDVACSFFSSFSFAGVLSSSASIFDCAVSLLGNR